MYDDGHTESYTSNICMMLSFKMLSAANELQYVKHSSIRLSIFQIIYVCFVQHTAGFLLLLSFVCGTKRISSNHMLKTIQQ